MDNRKRIALASGLEELNKAVIKSTKNESYEYTQVHYREFFFDKEIKQDFDICIISKLLPGEKDLDKLIFFLKSKNIRVIVILLDQDKEELETCIKYQITDVLTQPVKPLEILDTIENPKTFKDIDFIYKKLGLKFEIQENDTKEKGKGRRSLINIFSKKRALKEKLKTEKSNEKSKSVQNDNEKKQKNTAPEEKDVEIKNVEIQKEYRLVRAKKISFVNLSQGAGSTFITLNTAYAIKDFGVKPAVIELPNNNANILYQIAEEDDYVPLAWKIENDEKDYGNSSYEKDGITFYINKGQYSYDNWNTDKSIKFLNVATGKTDINLFDVGDSIDSYMLKSSDKIFIVVDPIPHKLLNSMDTLQKIKSITSEYAIKTVYVFNKWIDKLDRKDIEKYLQIKNSLSVNFVSPEVYYEAAYNNQVVYQRKEGKNILGEGLGDIVNEIIPFERKNRRRFKIKLIERIRYVHDGQRNKTDVAKSQKHIYHKSR